MTTIQFLAEWALRSSILILSGALVLWALRVKDPSIRLAAWTALLAGSLAVPALNMALPKAPLLPLPPLPRIRVASGRVEAPVMLPNIAPEPLPQTLKPVSKRFDWARAAVTVYILVAFALLLRLCYGLVMSLRLLRRSRGIDCSTDGIETRESDRLATPVTLGIVRPVIVLPSDWRQWDSAKLDAVLAHERSHVRRYDPAVQLLSAIHRVLLWHSPLSWFLHRRIVRVAEEASDDAAVAAIGDRALYAEVLLSFMQRVAPAATWQGVPMARYGRADQRIHRILDGTALSRGVTRWSLAAILALGSPIAYLVAAAQPQRAPVQVSRAITPETPVVAQPAPQSAAHQKAAPAYLRGLGNVSPSATVTIKPRIDGQLMSVSFKEGSVVQAGQVLASIDPQPYQIKLAQAESQLASDQAQLAEANQRARSGLGPTSLVEQLEGGVKSDQAAIDSAKLQLSYTQITAPITGVAGLRLVDPGNMVRATDTTGIVVINQVQPISVLFTIPEDILPQVLALLREGANPIAEAWNRDDSVKIATGRLTAVDNQIDQETGTAKLKAVFDNKDGVLFPNEFVVVHLLLNNR